MPAIARKTPDLAKADSRIKRYSRWVQNERFEVEGFYLPFVSELLAYLAEIRELVFVIDGSEVGHECITLMISLIYRKRTLPITWLVVKGCKSHLPEHIHLDLLIQLQAILPKNCRMVFLGDGEFDGINLQAALLERLAITARHRGQECFQAEPAAQAGSTGLFGFGCGLGAQPNFMDGDDHQNRQQNQAA